jgi:hypothetical protein
MRINKNELRKLITAILLEGVQDDRISLIKKFPENRDELNALPPKFINWLSDRFLTDRQKETHSFKDVMVIINKFAKAENAIAAKWNSNPEFKNVVIEKFPPADRRWQTPTDITTMTADQMNLIFGLSQRKKQRFKVEDDQSVEKDRVGKVGPWNLWLPTTKENSVKIAGYDPVTLEPKTKWCTARTAGSNLFYNYVGSPEEDTTLFYIIKDNPKTDWDWLSLGFVNGEPFLEGDDENLTVNRSNQGMTEETLRDALGDYYEQIIEILTKKNKELGGQHPAYQKIVAAADSIKGLNYLLNGISKTDRDELMMAVAQQEFVNDEVMKILAKNASVDVRLQIAPRLDISDDVLKILANDTDPGVRAYIAYRRNLPTDLMFKLASDTDHNVRKNITFRNDLSDDALLKLASDDDHIIRLFVARKQNLPNAVLLKLASDDDPSIRRIIAGRNNLSDEVVQILANDIDPSIRSYIAQRWDLSDNLIRKLVNTDDIGVKALIAQRRYLPNDVLLKLASDGDRGIKMNILIRNDLSDEVLEILAKDKNITIKKQAEKLIQRRMANKLDEMKLRKLIQVMIS